jgi:hypothetical protein
MANAMLGMAHALDSSCRRRRQPQSANGSNCGPPRRGASDAAQGSRRENCENAGAEKKGIFAVSACSPGFFA